MGVLKMAELRPELKEWLKQEKCKYNSIYVIPAQRVEDKFRQLQAEIDKLKNQLDKFIN